MVRIENADGAQLTRCTGKAASTTDDIYSVAIICDCVNARVRTNLKCIRCHILQIYRVAGVRGAYQSQVSEFSKVSVKSALKLRDI